jgi:hypothetical protein
MLELLLPVIINKREVSVISLYDGYAYDLCIMQVNNWLCLSVDANVVHKMLLQL